MEVHRDRIHKYLDMSLDFSVKGQCCVMMHNYPDGILEAFNSAVKEHGNGFITVGKQRSKTSAAPDNLFVINKVCENVSEAASVAFQMLVAKNLYVTKRARPDTSLAIAFLTKRVRAPDRDDWEKLCHLMEYLRADQDPI
jgi:hypothetical protein